MKKIKYLVSVFLIFILFLDCQERQDRYIYYVDMRLATLKMISCEKLKRYDKKKQLILTAMENDKLVTLFSKLELTNKKETIDTRLYGVVYDGSNKLEFCSGIGFIDINNRQYIMTDELRDYFVELTIK
ncbi:hypothetical protein PG357_04380 [Riemerella anatipestifer]|nr:hypothetical protein [Riemerella anatipestifer]MDY3351219.1 hypothetical protein [Riemerella anatipestifer]